MKIHVCVVMDSDVWELVTKQSEKKKTSKSKFLNDIAIRYFAANGIGEKV